MSEDEKHVVYVGPYVLTTGAQKELMEAVKRIDERGDPLRCVTFAGTEFEQQCWIPNRRGPGGKVDVGVLVEVGSDPAHTVSFGDQAWDRDMVALDEAYADELAFLAQIYGQGAKCEVRWGVVYDVT